MNQVDVHATMSNEGALIGFVLDSKRQACIGQPLFCCTFRLAA